MKRAIITFMIICFMNAALGLPSVASDNVSPETKIQEGATTAPSVIPAEHILDLYVAQNFVYLRDKDSMYKVSAIVEKLARAGGISQVGYMVRIINDTSPFVFSFSFAPGFLYVSTGLLDMLENEEELAAALAPAVARLINNYQLKTYEDIAKKIDRKNQRTVAGGKHNLFFGLGLFVSGVVLSVATLGLAPLAIGAVSGAVIASSGKNFKVYNLPKKRVFINRLSPQLQLPTVNQAFLVVFFKEVYEGYDADQELKADELAIGYLNSAGYKPNTFVAVLEKLSKIKDEYMSKGYASGLFLAAPGLENRIRNARRIVAKYQ